MSRIVSLAVIVGFMILMVHSSASSGDIAATDREKALALIKQLKGTCLENPNHPGKIGEVDLTQTKADDATLEAIACLTEVTALKLRACSVVGDRGLAAIAKMPALQILDVRGCKGITDSGFQSIGQLKSLRSLYAGNISENFTGAGLAHLRGLEGLRELGLGMQPKLEDRHLENLTGLTRLTELMLMGGREHHGRGSRARPQTSAT